MTSVFLKLSVFVQKHQTSLLLAGCGGVFTANVFYHVFPHHTYRKMYQAWSKGEPTILSEKLEKVVQVVLKDSAVSSPANYRAFAVYGFHVVGAGIPWLPSGALIGLPDNFNSTPDDPSEITNRAVLIEGQEVEWDSKLGAALKDSLLLSLDAQKFSVAREVARLECGGPVLHAAVAPVCLAGSWISSVALKQIFGLHAGSAILKVGANVLALGLGVVLYFLGSDAVNQWLEYRSDERAAGLSCDYAKGGVELYEKILSRNKTLRVLMGLKGEKMYAPSGNLFPAGLLSMTHAPYTSRRDGIRRLLKEQKT